MQCRFKLLPNPEGPAGSVRAVLQYKWLGLIWRDMRSSSHKLDEMRWKVIEAYDKLHQHLKEVERLQAHHDREVKAVLDQGDRRNFTGPVFTQPGVPFLVDHAAFIPNPGKAYDDVVKAIKEGRMNEDPDDLGIQWPRKELHPEFVGTRSAFLLAKDYAVAAAHGLVKEGEKYDHVIKFRSPKDDHQGGSNRRNNNKGGGNNNQNQGNKGGNSNS